MGYVMQNIIKIDPQERGKDTGSLSHGMKG
jgi:hypothetical protein